MGVPAVFLRLTGCNLLCGGHKTAQDGQLHDGATWRCDTIEVWSKGKSFTDSELVELFEREGYLEQLNNGAHLVITGGEPLQHQEELVHFLSKLHDKINKPTARTNLPFTEIETNGTIEPNFILSMFIDQWNVSPKLTNSGMPQDKRINPTALTSLANKLNSWCKVVINKEEDLLEVATLGSFFRQKQIILMPAASDRQTLRNLLPIIAEFCKKNRYRLSTRMQVEIWDKTTGV